MLSHLPPKILSHMLSRLPPKILYYLLSNLPPRILSYLLSHIPPQYSPPMWRICVPRCLRFKLNVVHLNCKYMFHYLSENSPMCPDSCSSLALGRYHWSLHFIVCLSTFIRFWQGDISLPTTYPCPGRWYSAPLPAA
jgi:hypothetical protein